MTRAFVAAIAIRKCAIGVARDRLLTAVLGIVAFAAALEVQGD
jgi:hypothetical protein